MKQGRLQRESVLRVGEVAAVTGRRILVAVDRDKNLSELFFEGDLLRNVAVGSYIDIRKGFLSLIGKVDGENAQPDIDTEVAAEIYKTSRRTLSVSLVGFVDRQGEFYGGTKELPLVGNEAFLLTKEKVHQVHDLVGKDKPELNIANSEYEGFEVALPVDGLMNSHIAIFGNTGSGKSNTLAQLYQTFISVMRGQDPEQFDEKCRILVFDFNGEYTHDSCLTESKTVYNLSTRNDDGDRIPLADEGLIDIEMLSIIADATEKTQKPFLRRAHSLRTRTMQASDPLAYAKSIVRSQVQRLLMLSEKEKAFLLIDYLTQVLPDVDATGQPVNLHEGLDWHGGQHQFTFGSSVFLHSNPDEVPNTLLYRHVENLSFSGDVISDFLIFAYFQLIEDVLANRAQNEHIAPAINKLRSKEKDIRKVFDPADNGDFFGNSTVVVNLNDVNLDMKKTIPLVLSRKIYQEHKNGEHGQALSFVIDEAHNILSRESARESETWKDYRLETFEEIIKEGRKFGVFVTIASQRPNDISPTITSQAHNYFIHRLINQKDLQSIASAVSYIDKLTEESIPTLPTGTCIFSGIAGQMPLKISIKQLDEHLQPKSTTLRFSDLF